MLYAVLTVFLTPLVLSMCDRWSHAAAVLLSWPLALPVLVLRELSDLRQSHKHQKHLENKKRELEIFEDQMERDQVVTKYLEE